MNRHVLAVTPITENRPEGWCWTQIRTLAEETVLRAGDQHGLPVLSVTKHRGIVRADDYFKKAVHGRDTSNYKVVRRGQFAYATIHLDEGSIGILSVEEAGIVSPMYTVFRTVGPTDPSYLLQALKSAPSLRAYRSLAEGTVNRRASIGFKDLGELYLLCPPSGEQQKIAAVLSSVDDAIEAARGVISQLGVVKKAMIAELLTRGLPGQHTAFSSVGVADVPAAWDCRPCGDLFDVQLGKMMSVGARGGSDQFPYLRNENVYWFRLDLDDVRMMGFDARERGKYRLRSGDLLACEGRHIGRCAIWKNEIDECYYQKALHRLRPKSDDITTDYMKFFMMLRFNIKQDLVAEANATSTIPHLPREKFMALPVWYPPRPEQEEITAVLNTLLERERAEEAGLGSLQQLKNALLPALLTGEVRVPVPPEASL